MPTHPVYPVGLQERVMFTPVPPAADQPEAAHPETDLAPLTVWRPRGRWPALLRLSWLCRLLARLSLIACGFWALFGLLFLTFPGADPVVGLLTLIAAVFTAFVSFIVWMGLAEFILLLIALERTARQTRDRLSRYAPDVTDISPLPEPYEEGAGRDA
jgi:hypothetical protein